MAAPLKDNIVEDDPDFINELDKDIEDGLDLAEKREQVPALDEQVGGGHYKGLKIEPMEYVFENNIPWAEGEIIKYVTRWKLKGGVQDLMKAKHILQFLIEKNGGTEDITVTTTHPVKRYNENR